VLVRSRSASLSSERACASTSLAHRTRSNDSKSRAMAAYAIAFKKPWKDGTEAVLLEPFTLHRTPRRSRVSGPFHILAAAQRSQNGSVSALAKPS
jgi:hypothetical protein